MRLVEKIVKENIGLFENKRVLEFACGEAALGQEISRIADKVFSSDIEDYRLNRITGLKDNFEIGILDAKNMHTIEDIYDTYVCFNGLGHMADQIEDVLDSIMKKMTGDNTLIFIHSWKLDMSVCEEVLLPLLKVKKELKYDVTRKKNYQLVKVSLSQ